MSGHGVLVVLELLIAAAAGVPAALFGFYALLLAALARVVRRWSLR